MVCAMASLAHGATVEWNLEQRGQLKGSGCDTMAQDTFLIEAGEQFSIIFTRFQARLDAGDNRKAEVNCRGSIPIAVHGDRYLDRIEQTLGYGWSKSKGAMARISARNKWYGRALSPINVNVESWKVGTDAYEEVFTQDDLKWGCKPNDVRKGSLDLDFSLVVQRSHPANETIDVNLAGHDMRYTAQTVWKNCNP